MIRLLIPLMLITLTGILRADTYFGELIGDRALVFREDASLFSEPRDTSRVVCSLPIGAELKRLAAVDVEYQSDGMSCTWMEGVYELDGDIHRGYIPQSWMALTDLVLSGDTLFIFGIDSYVPERWGFVGSARAVSGGDILWESVFYPPSGGFGVNSYGYSVSSREVDTSGFAGMQNLVIVSFNYEACGVTNSEVLFAWTGEYLVKGVTANWVAEAGIFHYTEEFLFPEEGSSLTDWVRVIATEEEFDDDNMEYFIVDVDTSHYSWNGLEFVDQGF